MSAYDAGLVLPSRGSRLINIQPSGVSWPVEVHIACTVPHRRSHVSGSSVDQRFTPLEDLPTVFYNSPSGDPGSLALLDAPDENTTYPGSWVFALQEQGVIGRVCTWDRPGYGFSEVMSGADLGNVADGLWDALRGVGESAERGWLLVGEGYGESVYPFSHPVQKLISSLVNRVLASRHPSHVRSLLHLDAQTALTYFADPVVPPISLLAHRLISIYIPALITPLGLTRISSIGSSSSTRILASAYDHTLRLNENILKARLQEVLGSHSHSSASFRALLESGRDYPRDRPAIIVSSQQRMEADEAWAAGQRGLASEVTSEEGLVEWIKVDAGHRVCDGSGRAICEDAVKRLLGV